MTSQLHVCGDPVSLPAEPSLARHPQVERICKICSAVKITVFPPQGGGYRMWRHPGSTEQVEIEPPCQPPLTDT